MKSIHLYVIGLNFICWVPASCSVSIENVLPPPPPPPPILSLSDVNFPDSNDETINPRAIPPPPPPLPPKLSISRSDGINRMDRREIVPNHPIIPQNFDNDSRSSNIPPSPLLPPDHSYYHQWTSSYPHPSYQQHQMERQIDIYKTNENLYQSTQQRDPRYIQPPYHTSSAYSPQNHRRTNTPPIRVPNPFQSQLVQRMTKSLDTLADVDDIAQDMLHTSATLVQQAAQTMKRSTQHAAGNVLLTGAAAANSIRGWMNRWRAIRGAPTQSDEAQTVWEEDRRLTIEANRRRRWLGNDETSDIHVQDSTEKSMPMGGSSTNKIMDRGNINGKGTIIPQGEPIIKETQYPTGVPVKEELTPFQRQLASLALPPAKDHDDDDSDIEEGDGLQHRFDLDKTTTPRNEIFDESGSSQPRDPREIFASQGRFDLPARPILESKQIKEIEFKGPPNSIKSLKSKSINDVDHNDELVYRSNKVGDLFSTIFTMNPLQFSLRHRKNYEWVDSEWAEFHDGEDIIKKSQQPLRDPSVEMKNGVTLSLIDDIKQRKEFKTQLIRRNTINLLSQKDIKKCRDIGRAIAFFDFIQLMLLFSVTRQCHSIFQLSLETLGVPESWTQLQALLRISMRTIFETDFLDSWLLHAFVAMILTGFTRDLLFRRKVQLLSNQVEADMKENALYAQLFSRITSGFQVKPYLSDVLGSASGEQVYASVAVARLRSFFILTLCAILMLAVSVDSMTLISMWNVVESMLGIISRIERPTSIDWKAIVESFKTLIIALFRKTCARAKFVGRVSLDDLSPMALNILYVSFLFLTSRMPNIQSFIHMLNFNKRDTWDFVRNDNEDYLTSGASLLSNMGATSANRINMLIPDGSIELFVDRWRSKRLRHPAIDKRQLFTPTNPIVRARFSVFHCICILLLTFPVFMQALLSSIYQKPIDWLKLIDMTIISLFTYCIARESIVHTKHVFQFKPIIKVFYEIFPQTNHLHPNPRPQRINDAIANTDGIEVRDLWVAHVAKRAWAIKGISLSGKKGEVTVILGDDASGKSRLITALAESLFNVPNPSRSTQIVRGSIYLSGSEVSQSNASQIKRKVGVAISSLRSLSDLSQLFSGMTLQEALGYGFSHIEKPAIDIASEITSISSTLFPRLPAGKLLTVVTANEDDLTRSPTSQMYLLSSSDCEKIVLTRVLAQIISANQSVTASMKLALDGAVLLLDDLGVHMNEIHQAKLLKNLRKSGATTLITSNRWSVGRFADRIFVLHNGVIVENGTHAELLDRGPQRSIYAARWKDMLDESK